MKKCYISFMFLILLLFTSCGATNNSSSSSSEIISSEASSTSSSSTVSSSSTSSSTVTSSSIISSSSSTSSTTSSSSTSSSTSSSSTKTAAYIYFDSNGGTVVGKLRQTIGFTYTKFPTSSKAGYKFLGWFYEEENDNGSGLQFTANAIQPDDTKLYAKWEPMTYTFTFDSMGGSSCSSQTLSYNANIVLPKPTKDGFTFAGWTLTSTSGIATGTVQTFSKVPFFDTEAVTLYAKWAVIGATTGIDVLGYANGGITDKSDIEETASNYIKVSTASDFLQAVIIDKENYDVIEIENDLDLGYRTLEKEVTNLETLAATGKIRDCFENKTKYTWIQSKKLIETGVTQIEINASKLLIYSKNGSKLTHCGFKVTYSEDVSFVNLAFDELWEWEDSNLEKNLLTAIGDYDRFGWSYFKIGFSNDILFDHCSFGKSYDGLIDSENSTTGVSINYCSFNGGDKTFGSFYSNMMQEIENSYQNNEGKYLFYTMARDKGISYDTLFACYVAPQKKGFMIGGGDDATKDEWTANYLLQFSIGYTYFYSLEDRLPRMRGGNGYVFNTWLDCSDYYTARTSVKKVLTSSSGSYSSTLTGETITIDYKNALVSQAMVTTNQGSVKFEKSIFEGVETLIKDYNATSYSATDHTGGYLVEDCIWTKGTTTMNAATATGNSSSKFTFSWRDSEGVLTDTAPFTPTCVAVSDLKTTLTGNVGAGVLDMSSTNFLKFN